MTQRAYEVQDAADFVTVRVPKGNLGAPVVVEKNYHIRVHGFLQSLDYKESLADFLKDARGAELPVPEAWTRPCYRPRAARRK